MRAVVRRSFCLSCAAAGGTEWQRLDILNATDFGGGWQVLPPAPAVQTAEAASPAALPPDKAQALQEQATPAASPGSDEDTEDGAGVMRSGSNPTSHHPRVAEESF